MLSLQLVNDNVNNNKKNNNNSNSSSNSKTNRTHAHTNKITYNHIIIDPWSQTQT